MLDKTQIGHNNPPKESELLVQRLRDEHNIPLNNAQKLIEAADRIPAIIEDDEIAGKATDYIKQLNGSKKTLEALRVSEKEPFLSLGRVVDGVFNAGIDAIEVAKKKALKPLDEHNKRKEAAERRRREEEAATQRKRAEEDRLAAEAMRKAQQTEVAAELTDKANIGEQVAATMQRGAEEKPCDMVKTRSETGATAILRTKWVGELSDILMLDIEALRYHIDPAALQKAINSFVSAGGRELRGANIFEKSETVVR